jgi:deaminated glutathione amidase
MRIAVVQMTSGTAPTANADVLVAAIEDAANAGAVAIFTPEMSGLLDRDRVRAALSIKTEKADAVLPRVCEAAKRHQIWVSLGSLALSGERADGRFVNRSLVVDDKGVIRARYDKLHLFDVNLATGETWRESTAYAPGEIATICEMPIGKLGLSICYDVRFPALYAALSQTGADILSIPAAFTVPTGKAHWHCLLRARAIENACYVVAAAQTGTHEDGRTTYGHSLVVDPWGEIILDMGTNTGLGFAEIDPTRVADVRARIPVLEHRRYIPHVTIT